VARSVPVAFALGAAFAGLAMLGPLLMLRPRRDTRDEDDTAVKVDQDHITNRPPVHLHAGNGATVDPALAQQAMDGTDGIAEAPDGPANR
jgi:hypothetical protein